MFQSYSFSLSFLQTPDTQFLHQPQPSCQHQKLKENGRSPYTISPNTHRLRSVSRHSTYLTFPKPIHHLAKTAVSTKNPTNHTHMSPNKYLIKSPERPFPNMQSCKHKSDGDFQLHGKSPNFLSLVFFRFLFRFILWIYPLGH